MRILLFCSLMISGNLLSAQNFETLIRNAKELYSEGNYDASAINYSEAFKIQAGNSSQYYNAACSWALTTDTIKSISYLLKSVEKGWKNLAQMKRDSDLNNLHQLQAWPFLIELVEANKTAYEKDFNLPLKEQLEDIYVRDQTLRQLYRDAETKFGSESEEMNYFWSLMSEEDHKNEQEVVEILKEHGWVGTSTVGGQANAALWLVIQHAPLEMQEEYLPLLEASVMQGESRGGDLALLQDRIMMRNGKAQIYGSQIVPDEETGQQKVYEILDPEYVNQRRKAVGLGPIEEYVARWGIEWTIEQKEK